MASTDSVLSHIIHGRESIWPEVCQRFLEQLNSNPARYLHGVAGYCTRRNCLALIHAGPLYATAIGRSHVVSLPQSVVSSLPFLPFTRTGYVVRPTWSRPIFFLLPRGFPALRSFTPAHPLLLLCNRKQLDRPGLRTGSHVKPERKYMPPGGRGLRKHLRQVKRPWPVATTNCCPGMPRPGLFYLRRPGALRQTGAGGATAGGGSCTTIS